MKLTKKAMELKKVIGVCNEEQVRAWLWHTEQDLNAPYWYGSISEDIFDESELKILFSEEMDRIDAEFYTPADKETRRRTREMNKKHKVTKEDRKRNKKIREERLYKKRIASDRWLKEIISLNRQEEKEEIQELEKRRAENDRYCEAILAHEEEKEKGKKTESDKIGYGDEADKLSDDGYVVEVLPFKKIEAEEERRTIDNCNNYSVSILDNVNILNKTKDENHEHNACSNNNIVFPFVVRDIAGEIVFLCKTRKEAEAFVRKYFTLEEV